MTRPATNRVLPRPAEAPCPRLCHPYALASHFLALRCALQGTGDIDGAFAATLRGRASWGILMTRSAAGVMGREPARRPRFVRDVRATRWLHGSRSQTALVHAGVSPKRSMLSSEAVFGATVTRIRSAPRAAAHLRRPRANSS